MKFKGQIEGFPQPIVELMLYYQGEQGNKVDVSVFEKDRECPKTNGGFDWEKTNEEAEFWGRVIHEKDFIPFYDLYPKEEQRGIRLDFKPKGTFDVVVENDLAVDRGVVQAINAFEIEIIKTTDADWYAPLIGERLIAYNNYETGGLTILSDSEANRKVFKKHEDLILPDNPLDWRVDRDACETVMHRESKDRKKQIGGNHYCKHSIQPFDIIDEYKLNYYEGNALKYLLRHSDKNGKEDLLKCKHYIDEIINRKYGTDSN